MNLRSHLRLPIVLVGIAMCNVTTAKEACEPIAASEIEAQWKHYSSLKGVQPNDGGPLYDCITIDSTLQIVCRTKPSNPAYPSIVIRTVEAAAFGSNIRVEADTAANCITFLKMMDQFKELDRRTFNLK